MEEEKAIEREIIDECRDRMELLGLHRDCIGWIERLQHACWSDGTEEAKTPAPYYEPTGADWSAEHQLGDHAKVFFVIRSDTGWGIEDACLFVDDNKDAWAYDREMLKQGRALAYVLSAEDDDDRVTREGLLQEIGVERTEHGGLRRTY